MQLLPFREINDLFDNYSRFFNRGRPALRDDNGELTSTLNWSPSADISETDSEYIVKADLPGVDKKNINVSLDKNVLTINGERTYNEETKDEKRHRIESFFGSFERSFTLPGDVKSEKIKASYTDGVLDIRLPKSAASKPKTVAISIN